MPRRRNRPQGPPTLSAQTYVRNLAISIAEFEAGLSDQESTQALFIAPSGETILVEGIGYLLPGSVSITGLDESGQKTLVVVPVQQAVLTIKAVVNEDTSEPPRRIGFLAGQKTAALSATNTPEVSSLIAEPTSSE